LDLEEITDADVHPSAFFELTGGREGGREGGRGERGEWTLRRSPTQMSTQARFSNSQQGGKEGGRVRGMNKWMTEREEGRKGGREGGNVLCDGVPDEAGGGVGCLVGSVPADVLWMEGGREGGVSVDTYVCHYALPSLLPSLPRTNL